MTSLPRVLVAGNASLMTLDGTRTYIIGEREPLIIDPGPNLAEHVATVVSSVVGARRVGVVATHGHADHAGCLEAVAERTGARIWLAGAGGAGGRGGESRTNPVSDGDILPTDAGRATVVATPGHTPDHIAILWEPAGNPAGRSIFVGDLLMGAGDTTLVASPEGDVREYLASLARLEALDATILYPAHGPPIENPRATIQHYRRHRLERVEQVRRALQERPSSSSEQLVEAIYGRGLEPRLRGAAAGSIEAAREYLRGGS